jgi:hypothetical protein
MLSFPRKAVVGLVSSVAILGAIAPNAHAVQQADGGGAVTGVAPAGDGASFDTTVYPSVLAGDQGSAVAGPIETPKPITVLQATAHPVTAHWYVPQAPQVDNELMMDLPAGRDHKLKEKFADLITDHSKAYGNGKQPKKITAWWRVTKVHANGQVDVELVQVQLVFSTGWLSGDFTSTTHYPAGERPSTEIGTEVKQ